jgi:DNA photolyase-like FAD binding protein
VPLEILERQSVTEGSARQVTWPDFHARVLSARPDLIAVELCPRGDGSRHAPDEFAAWQQGRTGLPVVDAGMRQLAAEGWLHNRARLIVATSSLVTGCASARYPPRMVVLAFPPTRSMAPCRSPCGACRGVAEDGGQGECAAWLVGSPPQPAVDGGIRLVLPGVLV